MIQLTVNKEVICVEIGTTVAAAVIAARSVTFRHSIGGEPRGPLCGMGVCFECRVSIDGAIQRRSCTVIAREGMEVVTGG